jgi:hypothetical protein
MRRRPLTMTPHEKREAILELWSGAKHYSSSEIGQLLGISKNSVVGIVNRARADGDRRAVARVAGSPLAARVKTYPPKPERRMPLRRKGFETPPRPVIAKPEVKTVFNIGLLECHYPLDYTTSDGFQVYCGADASEIFAKRKRSYCVEHHGRMYYKARSSEPVKKEEHRNVFQFNFTSQRGT